MNIDKDTVVTLRYKVSDLQGKLVEQSSTPMAYLHGWDKLMKFNEMAKDFAILPGVPPTVSLGLAVFAELVCAVLLAVGFLTRFAALNLVVTMGVAFFMAHGGKLSGDGSGEMAFIYLAGYTALLFTGAGKFSADGR